MFHPPASSIAPAGASGVDAQRETEIVLTAVGATKFPTLTRDDGARFRGLLRDLFPNASVALPANADLEAAIKEEAEAMKLELLPQQVGPRWLWSLRLKI